MAESEAGKDVSVVNKRAVDEGADNDESAPTNKKPKLDDNAEVEEKQEMEDETEPAVKKAKVEENGTNHISNGDTTEKERRIIEQMEYYFGNINLPRDKFLLEEIKKDDGWVPMSTMLKFNRLKTLCSDASTIISALRKSTSGLLEVVDKDGEQKIRRTKDRELPENSLEYWQQIKHRTIYVKGFDRDSTTLDELQEFFKKFGTVEQVLMRRTKAERAFKGSVFVTYDTRQACEEFVNNNDVVKYKESDLIKLMQESYWKNKSEELKKRRLEEKTMKQAKRLEELNAKRVERGQKPKDKLDHEVHMIKGVVLHIHNLPSEKVTVNGVKEFLNKFGTVHYVQFLNDEKTEAHVRFAGEENSAEAAWKKVQEAEEKVMFEGNELTANVLEGAAEEKYWEEFGAAKKAKFQQNKQKYSGGGRRGGRRGGGRDGGGERSSTRQSPRLRNREEGKKTVFNDSGDEGESKDKTSEKEDQKVVVEKSDETKSQDKSEEAVEK